MQDAELGSRSEQDQDSLNQCHYMRERKTEAKASPKEQKPRNAIIPSEKQAFYFASLIKCCKYTKTSHYYSPCLVFGHILIKILTLLHVEVE